MVTKISTSDDFGIDVFYSNVSGCLSKCFVAKRTLISGSLYTILHNVFTFDRKWVETQLSGGDYVSILNGQLNESVMELNQASLDAKQLHRRVSDNEA